LQPGDALVVNETKVIPARLIGERVREDARAKIEATLTKRESGDTWRALVKPLKRLQTGDRIRFGNEARVCMLGALDATVEEIGEGGEIKLRFDFHGPILDEAVEALGHMPLPPYIAARRADDDQDRDDYQTMFAKREGSVAAPTAGLHFTNELLAAIDARGVSLHRVTLHVGPGTFLPVKSDDTDAHKMHSEWGEVSSETAKALNAVRKKGGRIVAVGSTALRLLESAAKNDGTLQAFSGDTAIFITPGYKFKAVDLMLTNFHLPLSTLFMLVAAFSGLERMKAAYAHAIRERYRFFSYGDACLLHRAAA
jgi:S-adenosylmethionine:tRNA ribosyltransferase-isomerase